MNTRKSVETEKHRTQSANQAIANNSAIRVYCSHCTKYISSRTYIQHKKIQMLLAAEQQIQKEQHSEIPVSVRLARAQHKLFTTQINEKSK